LKVRQKGPFDARPDFSQNLFYELSYLKKSVRINCFLKFIFPGHDVLIQGVIDGNIRGASGKERV
jgi:hypothetical protein